jgi:hypothetical protein
MREEKTSEAPFSLTFPVVSSSLKGITMNKTSKISRALHVVDAANEIGSGHFTLDEARTLRSAYTATVNLGPNDLVMAATGPGTAAELAFGWGHGLLKIRPGQNGADYAIIDYLEESLSRASSFNHLYLGTGDHEMVPVVKKWLAAGVPVTIIARRFHVHHEYFTLPVKIVYLDDQWALAS